jgi:hypothetical protein
MIKYSRRKTWTAIMPQLPHGHQPQLNAHVSGSEAVQGEHGAAQPGAVGVEVSRTGRARARRLLQVIDVEFDGGVFPMEGVDIDRGTAQVGEEREVPPVRPQP